MDSVWLTVVSYPAALERCFEQVMARLLSGPAPHHLIERCQAPAELVYLVRRWKRRGYRVTRLDLVGHGGRGRFQLGDGLLFAADGTGFPLARRLGPQLAPAAEVRLLGCQTGAAPSAGGAGRGWLGALARELGGRRTVWGSTRALRPAHFGPLGLAAAAQRRLVSSSRPE